MTRDLLESPNRKGSKPPGPGRLVVSGVVGACVLGVALGIWARPTTPGEPAPRAAAAPAAKPTSPRPSLQIVVDDTPAPIGAPLEVLFGDVAGDEPTRIAPPPAPVEPVIVPSRPVSGLMKVDAVVAAAPIAAPAVHEAPKPAPKPKAAPRKPPKPAVAEGPRPDPKLAKAKPAVAKAAVAKARKADDLAQARAAKLEKAKAAKLADARKTEKARAVKMAKAEATRAKTAKLAKADKAAKATKLAQAEKSAKAETAAKLQKAKVEARRLAKVMKAVKAEARQAVRPKATKVAAVKPAAKPAPKPPKKVKRPVLRGEGPMRVARNNACASSDPGEAAVCADRRLGARDRQLQDAYRTAEAAGVPASSLRNQQSRWLAARAAAAREAPWAVEDVYVARISELRDQTRDAREE